MLHRGVPAEQIFQLLQSCLELVGFFYIAILSASGLLTSLRFIRETGPIRAKMITLSSYTVRTGYYNDQKIESSLYSPSRSHFSFKRRHSRPSQRRKSPLIETYRRSSAAVFVSASWLVYYHFSPDWYCHPSLAGHRTTWRQKRIKANTTVNPPDRIRVRSCRASPRKRRMALWYLVTDLISLMLTPGSTIVANGAIHNSGQASVEAWYDPR